MQVFTRHKQILTEFFGFLQISMFFHIFLLIMKKLLQKTMKILIKSEETEIIYRFLSFLQLLDQDPDLYTIYGSGSRRANNIQIQLDPYPDSDPQQCFRLA